MKLLLLECDRVKASGYEILPRPDGIPGCDKVLEIGELKVF